MTHGKTYNKSPRRINHKGKKSKTNTGTTALERSVEQTTGGEGGGGRVKALLQLANFTLDPDAILNTEIHKNSVRIKAPNSVNASNRKHKNQINHYNKQRRVLTANFTVCQSKWKPIAEPRRAKPKTYRQVKTLLQQGISEPEFYGDLVYRFRKLVEKSNFSEQFRKLINRYKRIGYSPYIMRQTACLVVNPIIVDGYASIFNCTTAVRASDSMTASS